jgi:flagellar hook-basal body complex protein FliE
MIIEGVLNSLGAAPTGLTTSATGAPGLGVGTNDGAGFSDTLKRMVAAVESTNGQANQAVMTMTDGTGDVHDAMIALQKADMTLQLTMQVRNKLINAYQEIMRMPV